MMKTVQHLQGVALKALLFFLPVFFLPLTTDAFDFNKLLLAGGLIVLFLIFWSLNLSTSGFKLRLTPFDLPVLAFISAIAASAILISPSKIDAFLVPGSATQIIIAGVVYFLVTQYLVDEDADKKRLGLLNALLIGGSLAGLIAFQAGLGVLGNIPGLPLFIQQATFTTLGSTISALTFFAILLPLAWSRAIIDKGTSRILGIVSGISLLLGFAAQGFYALPGKVGFPQLLPFETGWSIALETLKQNPLLGVGVGNFTEAFSRFKPQVFNSTDIWNLSFYTSSNLYLNLFTVAGVLGLGTFLWIITKATKIKGISDKHIMVVRGVTLFTAALFLLVPAGFVSLLTLFVFLGILGASSGRDLHLREDRGVLGLTQLLISFGLVAITIYGAYKIKPFYKAEMFYKSALESVTKNEGLATYNQMREAIRLNPRVVGYRTTNSQINLALANSIAASAAQNAQKDKGKISDDDRKNISTLIQQAISEGKAGVALAPRSSLVWTNLARIYRSLMGLADGADQFAIATYQQAIALDPVNPTLRLELGGVLFALKRYDDAVNAFDLAVAAKPDLANSHYNLAIALREAGKTPRAVQELNTTLTLLKEDSKEYSTVKKELEELGKKTNDHVNNQAPQVAPGTSTSAQDPLQAPQAVKNTVDPKFKLPEGTEPPSTNGTNTSVIPTPTPTPRN